MFGGCSLVFVVGSLDIGGKLRQAVSNAFVLIRVRTIVPAIVVSHRRIVRQSCNNRPRLFLADSLSDGVTLASCD